MKETFTEVSETSKNNGDKSLVAVEIPDSVISMCFCTVEMIIILKCIEFIVIFFIVFVDCFFFIFSSVSFKMLLTVALLSTF